MGASSGTNQNLDRSVRVIPNKQPIKTKARNKLEGKSKNMHEDITKPTSHIYWLWLAIFALGGACISGYLSLRSRDDCLAEKIATNELKLQVQLTKIETQLSQVNVTLLELKKDMRSQQK